MLVKEMLETFEPLLMILYFSTLPCQLLLNFCLCKGNMLLFSIYPSVVAILAIYILANRRKDYLKLLFDSGLHVRDMSKVLAEYEELLKKKRVRK